MGFGCFTTQDYCTYRSTTTVKDISDMCSVSVNDIYRERTLNQALSPYKSNRESRDSAEHPNSFPIIVGLDVTGSMGSAAQQIAAKLNDIMSQLMGAVPDVQFMFMGVGDIECDDSPIQWTQFESDVRMAEQLEKVYFEAGGGGNGYETYTTVWYMASRHCDLDCWKHGKKGLIITIGDEPLNPKLRKKELNEATGDSVQEDVSTLALYDEVTDKYDVFHISVNSYETCYSWYEGKVDEFWREVLGDHYSVSDLDGLSDKITKIIKDHYASSDSVAVESASFETMKLDADQMIEW